MNKKLYRDEYHKVLGGVCSGLAEYFDMDVTVVRLLFAFGFFVMGVGFIPYIILWIVLPKKGYLYNPFNNPTVDYTVPPQQPGSQFNAPPQPGNHYGNPFGGNPFRDNPGEYMRPPQKSNFGIIFGVVLIFIGGIILFNNYDLFPDFDFGNLWPIVLVIIGGGLILSGEKRESWSKHNWQAADEKENPATGSSTENTSTIEPDSDQPKA
jgi:phage shock protein PspC (stress-responsive transcriptional regulator)